MAKLVALLTDRETGVFAVRLFDDLDTLLVWGKKAIADLDAWVDDRFVAGTPEEYAENAERHAKLVDGDGLVWMQTGTDGAGVLDHVDTDDGEAFVSVLVEDTAE